MYNRHNSKKIEAKVEKDNMTEDEIKTEINEIRNNDLLGNKKKESSSDILNCTDSDSVTNEDESNNWDTETENHIIQIISKQTHRQMSGRDMLSKTNMAKSNKHTVKTYNDVLWTLLTDK